MMKHNINKNAQTLVRPVIQIIDTTMELVNINNKYMKGKEIAGTAETEVNMGLGLRLVILRVIVAIFFDIYDYYGNHAIT